MFSETFHNDNFIRSIWSLFFSAYASLALINCPRMYSVCAVCDQAKMSEFPLSRSRNGDLYAIQKSEKKWEIFLILVKIIYMIFFGPRRHCVCMRKYCLFYDEWRNAAACSHKLSFVRERGEKHKNRFYCESIDVVGDKKSAKRAIDISTIVQRRLYFIECSFILCQRILCLPLLRADSAATVWKYVNWIFRGRCFREQRRKKYFNKT